MSVASHYDGSAASYGDQYDPTKLWTNAEYPANYFRLELVRRILSEAGVTSAYEFGVGDASPLLAIASDGIAVSGNDVSPEMVRIARAKMKDNGLDPEAIRHLDVQDSTAISAEVSRVGRVDAVLALGVIPHVSDDHAFVGAMNEFLKPGGQLILQFRNELFSMFTFNRLTKEFILEKLLHDVDPSLRDVVASDLDKRLAVDKPPLRTRPSGDGYDEILSRFHNPFELANIVESFGYSNIRFHWYNYHPIYPMLSEQVDARELREAQVALEGDKSWRGMFMCSAGLIQATKDFA